LAFSGAVCCAHLRRARWRGAKKGHAAATCPARAQEGPETGPEQNDLDLGSSETHELERF
jgi:hypothetical protein